MATVFKDYRIHSQTANFRIVYDQHASPLAFLEKRPNYYVVFKNTEKIEAATSSIFAAESMMEAAQTMFDRLQAGEPLVTDEETTPPGGAPDGGMYQ